MKACTLAPRPSLAPPRPFAARWGAPSGGRLRAVAMAGPRGGQPALAPAEAAAKGSVGDPLLLRLLLAAARPARSVLLWHLMVGQSLRRLAATLARAALLLAGWLYGRVGQRGELARFERRYFVLRRWHVALGERRAGEGAWVCASQVQWDLCLVMRKRWAVSSHAWKGGDLAGAGTAWQGRARSAVSQARLRRLWRCAGATGSGATRSAASGGGGASCWRACAAQTTSGARGDRQLGFTITSHRTHVHTPRLSGSAAALLAQLAGAAGDTAGR